MSNSDIQKNNIPYISSLMFALMRFALTGKEISNDVKEALTDDVLKKIYLLSKKHDMAHIVGHALDKNKIKPSAELAKAYKNQVFAAICRYERTDYEFKAMCNALSEANIPYLPLKGSVIRGYYPDEWMRTSCDIDILIHEGDIEKATEILVKKLGYKNPERHYHDVSLTSQSGVNIELHFSLSEGIEGMDGVLCDVWDYAKPCEIDPYKYSVSNEFLMFYLMAHTAYHFLNGGCGIRPFADLWILKQNLSVDEDKYLNLLEKGKLLAFAKSADELAEFWFGKSDGNDVILKMQEFILKAGVFGDFDNLVAVQQVKKGGNAKYVLSRIWLPFESLKANYPSVEKHRILTPFYQVKRWFSLLVRRKQSRGLKELNISNSIDKRQRETTAELLKHLELL